MIFSAAIVCWTQSNILLGKLRAMIMCVFVYVCICKLNIRTCRILGVPPKMLLAIFLFYSFIYYILLLCFNNNILKAYVNLPIFMCIKTIYVVYDDICINGYLYCMYVNVELQLNGGGHTM